MFTIDLGGKTAIVTGGSQGLGLVTAQTLHHAGANVAIGFFPDEAGGNRARAELAVASLGDRAMAIAADVRDLAAVERMVDGAIDRFGGLDILVNNAGILRDKTLRKMAADDWQAVIDTNLTGVFNGCRAACDRIGDGGRIVNISSISAAVGSVGYRVDCRPAQRAKAVDWDTFSPSGSVIIGSAPSGSSPAALRRANVGPSMRSSSHPSLPSALNSATRTANARPPKSK
jgi:NAD(P)-dependent dehydrogenase (short-subunit alcohol dehydrogenase family)